MVCARPQGMIIEGVTGAGKTSTIAALRSNDFVVSRWAPYDFFSEDETFGEFMTELRERPELPVEQRLRLLNNVVSMICDRSAKSKRYHFIIERAHFSYYALLPKWQLYRTFDEKFATLNAHVFLLWLPENELQPRSLYRSEASDCAERFIEAYGSEAKALDAIRRSQANRYGAIEKSAIPYTIIDTSAMQWQRYADEIAGEVQKGQTARFS